MSYLVLVVPPYAANREHFSALSAGFLRELGG
jgi:hypothetical protein